MRPKTYRSDNTRIVRVGSLWRRREIMQHRTFRVIKMAVDYVSVQPHVIFELLPFMDPKLNGRSVMEPTIFVLSLQDFRFQMEKVRLSDVPEGTLWPAKQNLHAH